MKLTPNHRTSPVPVSDIQRAVRRALAAPASVALLAAAGFAAVTPAHAQSSTVSNSPISSDAKPTFSAGPLDITFGGFTALESVWRSKDETADIGSNYNTLIPFAYQPQDHFDEFRESARQSRFAMLVQGPQDGAWSAQYYLETDFLSAGVTSNSNESNSYTLRMRHFYGVLRNSDADWYLLAGQTWSLATMSTSGTLAPRAEQVPLTIDAQYAVGFNWTRNAQLRFVKLLGNTASFGLSFESPQGQFAGGATPSTTITTEPGQGSGLLNTGANYAIDFAPDTIAKFAINPGWGHYEIYGMERGFRDRYEPIKGSVAGTNNTTWGGSVGAGVILPFTKQLDFQASALWGNGIGRYGSGGLPDYVVNPDGSISAIREADVLLGLVYKPTSRLQLYAYGGEEQAQQTGATAVGTTLYGYGNPDQVTSGCYLLTGTSATCAVNTQKLEQLILGEWWKAYDGPIGNFQIGLQYTYEDRLAFLGRGGAPSTNLNMGFASFRYYPYQR
ncbi:MAG TPA: hypothetical protein VMD56_09010 [Steroidobacteraceae bacterium]|nr:hypothetical protein [Steroidobacteraceae bacterium]